MPPRTRQSAPAGPETPPSVDGEQALPGMPEPPPEPVVGGDPEQVTVFVAWGRVMRDVGAIGKNERNRDQNFNFRGVDAVVNIVGPVLRKHGVFVVPESVVLDREERYETKRNQTAMHAVITHQMWRVYGPAGDSFPLESLGQSSDSGDKVVAKAQSVAYRVVLLQSLCIPTDDRDPDADAHERSGQSDEGRSRQRDEQPSESADPRVGRWNEIIAKAKTFAPPWDMPAIGRDFAQWRGCAINAPEVTVSDLVRYLAIMDSADRVAYVPTADDERHVAAVQAVAAPTADDAARTTRND